MLTPLGVVKLMDFGIAKAQTESDLTRPGTTMGSLYYMSPEQVRGGTVDARSDIYSVGVVMYELLAGRRPFEANSAYDILNQQCNVAPRPPLEINPQLPAALNEIILCALQKDPANRFQNAQAIQNALRQVAAAPAGDRTTEGAPFTPIVIPEAPQPANFPVAAMAPPPPSSSHRGAWIALGALAVLVVVGAAAAGLPRLLHTSAKTESESPAPPVSAAAVASPPAVAPPPAAASTTADQAATGNAPNTPAKSADAPATATMKAPVAKKEQLPTPPRPAYNAEGATPGAVAAKQPENAGPTADDMQQAQEQKIHLDARASTVSASVESLKSQQEAAGLGLRHDMAGAYARMTSYLGLANDALQSGNLAAARGYMDKADKEISTLESFFGK